MNFTNIQNYKFLGECVVMFLIRFFDTIVHSGYTYNKRTVIAEINNDRFHKDVYNSSFFKNVLKCALRTIAHGFLDTPNTVFNVLILQKNTGKKRNLIHLHTLYS